MTTKRSSDDSGRCRQAGVSLLEVAIGGLAAQPAVASVIAGATRPDQIAGNARAARWVPSEDDLRALDEIVSPPTR